MGKGEYTDGKVKVTVRLDPALVRRAKVYGYTHRRTLQALVERGLRHVLALSDAQLARRGRQWDWGGTLLQRPRSAKSFPAKQRAR